MKTKEKKIVSASAGGLHKMGESVKIEQDSLTFRCAMDNYASLHTYPRSSDPGFSTALGITTTTSNNGETETKTDVFEGSMEEVKSKIEALKGDEKDVKIKARNNILEIIIII